MILGERFSKNCQKCESDIDNDENDTLLTCNLTFVYLVLYIVLNTKRIKDVCLPTCVDYTHIRIHIYNYADMILYATCYKRPPVLSDRFCWTGGRSPKIGFNVLPNYLNI